MTTIFVRASFGDRATRRNARERSNASRESGAIHQHGPCELAHGRARIAEQCGGRQDRQLRRMQAELCQLVVVVLGENA